MLRQILTLFTFAIFLSCGRNNNIETKIDHQKLESKDTIQERPPEKEIENRNTCAYDNQVSNLGIGLIIAPSKFDIYNDSLLKDKMSSYDMYGGENEINICSKFFNPDYGIMHFVCISKNEKSYMVLVNFSEIKYIPRLKNYVFKTWDEYITQSYGIRRITNDHGDISGSHPLRSKPNNTADTLTIPNGHEMFCPMEIKGDWVKVKYDCFYNDENNPYEGEPCKNYIEKCKNPLSGWLRWREENQLLIDIFLMP